MRFLENGPSIPDRLLTARDEGRVVFFCGAGVSRACAGLSGFFGLARQVVDLLGVSEDNDARRVLYAAKKIDQETGMSGLVSADRVFGILERGFLVDDIEHAVATALTPNDPTDLRAHKTLIDLARTPEGCVQLVTTNFDRLFEDCDDTLKIWQPPRFPDLEHGEIIDGIVHLHGIANKSYSGSNGEPFVLSSAQFGRAYLSDGWATQFIRSILDRYFVVFVGYAADDPPVQYLLEALNISAGNIRNVYALQAGSDQEAQSRWRQKGATPILYRDANGHDDLWDALDAWSVRARDIDGWHDAVIQKAMKGPEALASFERGQVAHLVSTLDGARRFYDADVPPPADWLCVFDPLLRFAKPNELGSGGPFFDPFGAYGIDSDETPPPIDPKDFNAKREAPDDAWSCFSATRLDSQSLSPDRFSTFRGYLSTNAPALPRRLNYIGLWIAKVANRPASVWWAAHQIGLHPEIQLQIEIELYRDANNSSAEVRRGWGYLFEAWSSLKSERRRDWFDLKNKIKKDGWSKTTIRELMLICRPYVTAKKNYWDGPRPPQKDDEIRLNDMVSVNIEYSNPQGEIDIDDEWIACAVRAMQHNLEVAVQKETEMGGYDLRSICPIVEENPADGNQEDRDNYERTHGISGYMLYFVSLFERLTAIDISVAKREVGYWPIDDDTVFAHLRIWAASDSRLIEDKNIGRFFFELNDGVFWDGYHQRDILLSLAKRWTNLGKSWAKKIGKRLLDGRGRWANEEEGDFLRRRAECSLNRIHWLKSQGCEFAFDIEKKTKKLLLAAPEWKNEFADGAAAGLGVVRSGWVKTDDSHDGLLNVPLHLILDKAVEQSGRDFEPFVERDPFAGFVSQHPVRAFGALTDAARRDEYPEWAWRTFLNHESRKTDKPRFSALIAHRITRCPSDQLTAFMMPTSEWLLRVGKTLASEYPDCFDKLISYLIETIRGNSKAFGSSLVRRNDKPDWVMEAINAPTGKIAEALMKDQRKDNLIEGQGFPVEWRNYWDVLFNLPDDLSCHALTIAAFNLNWFFHHDPDWTQTKLLSNIEHDGKQKDAIWCGLLWGGKPPPMPLYNRLKKDLRNLVVEGSLGRRGYRENLAALVLYGWGIAGRKDGEAAISNEEMRNILLGSDEEFRSQILWLIKQWANSNNENPWPQLLPEFLRVGWPRQKSVKSPAMSASLCGVAFSNEERFEEVADIVLQLLTPVDQDRFFLPELRKSGKEIIEKYPEKSLALLFAVLSEDIFTWPYEIGDVLEAIGEADESLKRDSRLLELNRRWNSR